MDLWYISARKKGLKDALNTFPHDLDFLLEKAVYKSHNIVIYFLH